MLFLPPVTGLERDHFDLVFHNFAVRNYVTYSEPVVEVSDEHLTDWQIYLNLAEKLDELNGKSTQTLCGLCGRRSPVELSTIYCAMAPMAKVQHALTLDKVKAHPHGIDLGPLATGFTRSNISIQTTIIPLWSLIISWGICPGLKASFLWTMMSRREKRLSGVNWTQTP